MKQKNIEENISIIRAVEVWSASAINAMGAISHKIESNDSELIEKAVRDIIVTNQINVLLTFPNYTRWIVIKALVWYEHLSMENIFFVEKELYHARDDYELDDMDFKVVLRNIECD